MSEVKVSSEKVHSLEEGLFCPIIRKQCPGATCVFSVPPTDEEINDPHNSGFYCIIVKFFKDMRGRKIPRD